VRAENQAQRTFLCRPNPWSYMKIIIFIIINPLKPKERVRKDSIRVEVKRKHLGES
jgi:hypothetical protein